MLKSMALLSKVLQYTDASIFTAHHLTWLKLSQRTILTP